MMRLASPGSAARDARSKASGRSGGRAAGAVPAQPLLPSAQQQARSFAPAHRPVRGPSEFPVFDDLKQLGVDRLPGIRPLLRRQCRPGHDGILVDRQRRRLQREHDRGAAAPSKPSRGRRENGRAQQARRQHADDLSRRRCRQTCAERPDPARRRATRSAQRW